MTWASNLTAPLPWYADPIWGFVSSIAQIVSLIAIGGAIVGWARTRRKVAPVVWGLDLMGTADIDGDKYHLAELHNAGTGAALVQSVHLIGFVTIKQVGEHRLKTVMGSGDRVTFPFTAEQVDQAWILITWVAHDDNSKLRLQWLPVARPGAMYEASLVSRARSRRTWWQLSKKDPRPVGPHYFSTSSLKLRSPAARDKFDRDFEVAYQPITLATTIITWGIHGSARIEDIPLPDTTEVSEAIALAAQIAAERQG
jgi:hypothetical protein